MQRDRPCESTGLDHRPAQEDRDGPRRDHADPDAGDLWVRLQQLLATKTTSLREELKSYAAEKGVQI